ncbi:putative mushroom body vesicular transporter portabella [Musca autumnalis]|uniref:putative mushroom body vesicular transporter portabella n=1 Tax=Musca autumnalis TaxID=221902 RepID=UPI003CEA2220
MSETEPKQQSATNVPYKMDTTHESQHASTLNPTYNQRRTSSPNYGTSNRNMIAVIVYLALLLDNVLLTVIVPILPDYLATINNRTLLPPTTTSTARMAFTTPGTGKTTGSATSSSSSLSPYNNNNTPPFHVMVGLNNSGGPVGPVVTDTTASAQHMAYRNLDGTVAATKAEPLTAQHPSQYYFHAPSQQQQQQHHQPPTVQHVMTKHPIPGKSMVNFSLIHLASDDNGKLLLSTSSLTTTDHHHQQQSNSGNAIKFSNNNNASVKGSRSQWRNENKFNNKAQPRKANESSNDSLQSENGSIGVLLAMKALVQLIFNPIVGNLSTKYGYRLPIVMGTFFLLISSLVFAVGETYAMLLIARSVQGIGSACIGVCGMSLVAQHYPEEDRRSKIMGIILGSIALGVLLGYPFGGILYDLFGKSAPFIILSTIIFINLGLQLITMDLSVQSEAIVDVDQQQKPKWKPLLQSKMILAIVVAIWFSTSTMAILEPCLPLWLMTNLKPNKWQLGTVFIPDSVGYFVGTNFFGSIAYRFGQIKVSCLSLLLVGISSILIPTATTVSQLLLPHFGLGLGIGIIDAALVPLLATFVDATLSGDDDGYDARMETIDTRSSHSMSSYGSVYAIQQTSVSLAYCLAPLLGGELAQALGFVWLMRIVGAFNIVYGPILVYLYYKYDPKVLRKRQHEMLLSSSGGSYGRGSKYKQLYNSVDNE